MGPRARFEVFPERDDAGTLTGNKRIRLVGGNNEVELQGTESYRDDHDAERGIRDAVATIDSIKTPVGGEGNFDILIEHVEE